VGFGIESEVFWIDY